MNLPNRLRRPTPCSAALLAAFALAALASAPARGQGTAASSSSTDQTVVLSPFNVNVTTNGYATDQTMSGSRVAQSIADVPISVAIINAEQLADIHAVNSQEAVEFGAPGFSPNTRVSDDYNVRGFRTEFVLEDGVTITQSEEKPLYDVDRVEVIRGPIATTLGSNGSDFLGGVINFITRQPTPTPEGYVGFTGGNYGYLRMEGNASGPLYHDDEMVAEYRVTLGATKGTPEKPIETLNEQFIGAGLKAMLGKEKTSELDFMGSWYQHRNYLYYEDFSDVNSTAPGDTLRFNQYSTPSFEPALPQNTNWKYSKFVLQGMFKSQLTSHTNLRLLVEETGAKDRRMLQRGITINPDNVTLQRQAIPFETYKYFATGMLDITNHHDLGFVVNDLSTGLEDDDIGSTQWQQVYTMPTIDVRAPDFSQDSLPQYTARNYFLPPNGSASQNRSNNFAGYVEDNATFLNGKLILVGGVRDLDTRATTINYVTNVMIDKSTGRENTHKYGAVFKPVKGVSFYYSAGTDFIPLTGFLITGAPEAPEIGTDSEWGVKLDYALNDRVSVYGTATHFDTKLTNVVINVSEIVGGTLITGNGQNAENTTGGYELQLGSRLGAGPGNFDVVFGYYSATTNVAGSLLAAQDAVPWSYSVLGKYTFNDGSLKGLAFGAGVYDEGKRLELTGVYIYTPTTVNLFALYHFGKHWTVQANIDNVGNRYYIAAAAATGLVEAAPLRTWQGELKYSW